MILIVLTGLRSCLCLGNVLSWLLGRNYYKWVSVLWALIGLFFFNFFSICPCWIDWQFSVSYISKYWHSEYTDKIGKIEILCFFSDLVCIIFFFCCCSLLICAVCLSSNSYLMIPKENQLLLWLIMEVEWLLNSLTTGLFIDCQSLQDKETLKG